MFALKERVAVASLAFITSKSIVSMETAGQKRCSNLKVANTIQTKTPF